MKKFLCRWFGWFCPETPPPPPPPPPDETPARIGLLYGYYGGGDISAVANHTNVCFPGTWGDWSSPVGRQAIMDKMVAEMHEAVANGVLNIMLGVDFCLWDLTNPRRLRPSTIAQPILSELHNRLYHENLLRHVVAIYLIDEPNILENSVSDPDLHWAIVNTRAVFGEIPITTTYGWNGNWTGIQRFDWVGWDDYGTSVNHYSEFVNHLLPVQKVILVPGCSYSWLEDPQPFYDKAQQEQRVIMIMPFLWGLNPEGLKFQSQALIDKYVAVGTKIKAAAV